MGLVNVGQEPLSNNASAGRVLPWPNKNDTPKLRISESGTLMSDPLKAFQRLSGKQAASALSAPRGAGKWPAFPIQWPSTHDRESK